MSQKNTEIEKKIDKKEDDDNDDEDFEIIYDSNFGQKEIINEDNKGQKEGVQNEKKEKKNNFNIDNELNKYILSSPLVKNEMFNSEKCDICFENLNGIKYICCLCDNCILCEKCELYHNHPCFKFKNKFLFNILDMTKFMESYLEYKSPYESTSLSKIFRKELDLKIEPLSDTSFSLRPSQKIFIPIKILNFSGETINSSQFVIICKNQKNIFLEPDENKKFDIPPKGEYILKIKCITPHHTCPKEKITIEIYSHVMQLKSSSRLIYEYNIEVNYDFEEDKVNMSLKNDECIFCFDKNHKNIILQVMKDTVNIYNINNVVKCLMENKWNAERAIKELKKRN